MLSIYTLKSAAKAGNYYQEDNYYAKEGEEPCGVWFGKGAVMLGLADKAKLGDFIAKLEGNLAENIKMETTTKKHRPGYDLTFSAPKSVSILAIVGRDERVLNAHRDAVNETLAYLEKHYAKTRVKVAGKTTIQSTANLLITKFEHTDSRALDPNLHTHCIVINSTQRADGKWRTLYFDEVYDDKMLLGVIYRGHLAQQLMKAGFEITQTSEKGLFELKAFPENLIKQLSKRRQQITQELEKRGLDSSKAAQIANFSTRESKKIVDPEHLELAWTVELNRCGYNLEWLKNYSKEAIARGEVTPPDPYQLAHQAVLKAAQDLGHWRGVFTNRDLIKTASGLSVGNYSPTLLEKVIAQQAKSGTLVYLGKDLFTTQAARDLEMLNIRNMKQGKNKVFPMFTKLAANYLAKLEARPELKTLLTNTDNQLVITSKTEKNYLATMQSLVALSYQYGFTPRGITQTAKRKEEMAKELGLERVQTIKGFLMSCANRAEKIKIQPIPAYKLPHAKQIWILDLHSSISASQVNEIQNYAKEFGARIIWANKANKPQAAISALLHYGVKECCLDHKQSINEHASALMPRAILTAKMNMINKNFEQNHWQTNVTLNLIHWLAVKHSQHHAVFSVKQLQLELFSLGITVPKEVLQSQLDQAVKQSLVNVTDGLVTTKETVALEQTCLKLVTDEQATLQPIASSFDLPKHLTVGQKKAISLVLTTQDRVVGIQGVAGAGKTTMLRSLNRLCKDANFEIIGLTPTTSAKQRLQESSYDQLLQTGIKTFTVRQFLIESEKLLKADPTLAQLEYGANKLLVLDEASFVSTAEMVAVITKVKELNARLVVMGDYRQLSSVEAGRIFYLMLGSSMASTAMTENVRFKSYKTLEVMQAVYQNKITDALAKLGNSLVEIPDHNERLTKMAELYLAKTALERQNTILITPEHADRKAVNQEIRQGLKKTHELSGTEVNCYNLTQVKLTKAEQQKIYFFENQNLVTFLKIAPNLKVNYKDYYLIINKDLDQGTLTLENQTTKEQITWSPEKQASQVSVYQQEARGLMVNDQIRWTINNKELGIYNGQTAIIQSIDDPSNAKVLLDNGQTISLNLKKLINQHWDHAYAVTTFVAQGADKKCTIALVKGGYIKEILMKNIKVNDVLITKEHGSDQNIPCFKLVRITALNQDHIATAQDREGNNITLDLKKSPTNLYCKDQAIWLSYPDPELRKGAAIPKLTSIAEFLVIVTRGDEVIILVDHIESYLHALKQRITGTRSAMEYLDPGRKEKQAKLDQMVANITGQAKKEVKKASVNHQVAVVKNSLYINHKVTMEQVIDKLHSNVLHYATNWLGQPQKVTSTEARWGKKGSFVVKLAGEKTGYWHNFEQGSGGKNLLSLYTERFNRDFKTAIKELANALYLDTDLKLFAKTATNHPKPPSTNVTTLDPNKIKYINKIYDSGVELSGTLAEKYLRECRGVKGDLPRDFRFCDKLKHPDLGSFNPALIAPIKTIEGKLQAIVRIFLNADGNKLNATYIDNVGNKQQATVKANLGSVFNAAVTISKASKSNTIYIAEGIETALSIAQAKPGSNVVAALSVSNLKNVPLPNDIKKVVLCADYDGNNAGSNKALMVAAKSYLEKGLDVTIAYPENIAGMKKIDFNDVLKNLGTYSIVKSLQNAIPQQLTAINKIIESNNSKAKQTTAPKSVEVSKTIEVNNLQLARSKELSL